MPSQIVWRCKNAVSTLWLLHNINAVGVNFFRDKTWRIKYATICTFQGEKSIEVKPGGYDFDVLVLSVFWMLNWNLNSLMPGTVFLGSLVDVVCCDN